MNLIEFIDKKENIWYLKIKVIPNSDKTEIVWLMDDWVLKIKSRWIPENWKVNLKIIDFISKNLWINKKFIQIVSWETSRNKLIKIAF